MLANTAQGLYDQRLPHPNCPVLDPWAKVDLQTALVLLGAYFRSLIRRRALRAPSLDPQTFLDVALRAVKLSLAELGKIDRMHPGVALLWVPTSGGCVFEDWRGGGRNARKLVHRKGGMGVQASLFVRPS